MINLIYYFFLFLTISNFLIYCSSNIFCQKIEQNVMLDKSNLSFSGHESFKIYKNRLLYYSKNNKFLNIKR